MEDLEIGTNVKLSQEAKENTYEDMDWKDDVMKITYKENDGEGMGKIYSFDSVSSDKEITCSMYGYELKLA